MTTQRIITRPNAGSSYNAINIYRVVENNQQVPDPPNVNKTGWLRVTPAWPGSIMYGLANEGPVARITIAFEIYQNLGLPDDTEPGCDVTIDPPPGYPGYDTATKKRARAHAVFYTTYGQNTLKGFEMDEAGAGYNCQYPPGMTLAFWTRDYTEPPGTKHYLGGGDRGCGPRCWVFPKVMTMQTAHNIEPGDELLIRWKTHDPARYDPNPDQIRVRHQVVAVGVSGGVIHLGNGYPEDDKINTGDAYYHYDGGWYNGWGGPSMPPTWADPTGYYDPEEEDPYKNAPPWTFSVYRYDPEPVYFVQDKGGGPIQLGAYVAVHERMRDPQYNLRICWPLDYLNRVPYWGQ
jgi:hypothetical protein